MNVTFFVFAGENNHNIGFNSNQKHLSQFCYHLHQLLSTKAMLILCISLQNFVYPYKTLYILTKLVALLINHNFIDNIVLYYYFTYFYICNINIHLFIYTFIHNHSFISKVNFKPLF